MSSNRIPLPDGRRRVSPFRRVRLRSATWGAFLILGALAPLQAQLPAALTNQLTLTSVSGQFVVHANRTLENVIVARSKGPAPIKVQTDVGPPIPMLPLTAARPDAALELDPRLVAVVAERVKRVVLAELGYLDRWQGKIHVFLQPPPRTGEPAHIVSQRFREGWQYSVAVSRSLSRAELNRGLIEVILLEIANRDLGPHLVQPPLWLAEGLSGIASAELERDPIASPQTYLVRDVLKPDRLGLARINLQHQQPLSFTQLSLPKVEELADPAAWNRFQASALLFTHELLANPATRAGLRDTLQLLPRHLNWQTAFLKANRAQFLSLLEVEKWWAVNVANFKSHDPAQLWSRERCLEQLASLVSENVDIRSGTNAPVSRQQLSLSQVISRWGYDQQREVLQRKVNQLRLLWPHAGSEIAPLVAAYYQTLSRYLAARSSGGDREARMDVEPRAKVLARDAARRLDDLDRQLAAMRSQGTS